MTKLIHQGSKDLLKYYVYEDRDSMGKKAADIAIREIKRKLEEQEEVRMIFAAAPSQNETLYHLTQDEEIDWSRIVGFHMDEYLGLPQDSDKLFRNYLLNHLLSHVEMKAFHFIDSSADPGEEAVRYTNLLEEKPIDVICLGIGENGHIAFNDPPVADFEDPETMKIVELDERSRIQQVNDGVFQSIEEVPTHALTLTIPPMMRASCLVCTVPGPTKKEAVSKVLTQTIDTSCPATILRKHENAHLIIDQEAYGG